MCNAHSKVTHIKQQKYFNHLKGREYNKNSALYPRPFIGDQNIFVVLYVSLCYWPTHTVIKQKFFWLMLLAYTTQQQNIARFSQC